MLQCVLKVILANRLHVSYIILTFKAIIDYKDKFEISFILTIPKKKS